jgi:hypothetical protein
LFCRNASCDNQEAVGNLGGQVISFFCPWARLPEKKCGVLDNPRKNA